MKIFFISLIHIRPIETRLISLSMISCLLLSDVSGVLAADNELLQFFEEEAQVITASRRKESVRDTPLPVDVITAEDMRASGALNLWDLLRFRLGMDVLDMNTQGFSGMGMVSVRGFPRPRSLVRQILVLIDGRSVITPLRSNANWGQLQVQLQDIERIEIVRGPSAALFDSNAALGTIHIITKKPRKMSMASASALGGSQGIRRTEAMGEGTTKDFSYRFSHTNRAQDGTVVPPGVRANNFLFSNKGNFRGVWIPNDETSLDIFAGGSWDTLGDNVVTGTPSQDRFRSHFQMLRLERSLGTNSTLEVMAARNDDADDGDSIDIRNLQYDLDVLHRIGWGEDRMNTAWGTSYRYASAESPQFFPGEPRQRNEVYRGFVHQSMKVLNSLTVTVAGALEDSDTGGLETAYQTALLYRLTDDHRLRFAHGLAPTLPTPLDKYGTVQQGPTRKTVGNPDLDADRLQSYELGYLGQFFQGRFQWETNFFYNHIRDLAITRQKSKVGPLTTFHFQNANSAIARGIELGWTYKFRKNDKLYANYTFENITDSLGDIAVQEATPHHKFNLGAAASLPHGFSASFNIGYKDKYRYENTGADSMPAYWRLDARLAYRIKNLELFVAGQNLTRPLHHFEFQRSLDVPRTYYGGLSLHFGGNR